MAKLLAQWQKYSRRGKITRAVAKLLAPWQTHDLADFHEGRQAQHVAQVDGRSRHGGVSGCLELSLCRISEPAGVDAVRAGVDARRVGGLQRPPLAPGAARLPLMVSDLLTVAGNAYHLGVTRLSARRHGRITRLGAAERTTRPRDIRTAGARRLHP